MPTARPSSEATFMVKIERLKRCASRYSTPSVTVTARPPPITGRAAATTLPKTMTSTIRANGRA